METVIAVLSTIISGLIFLIYRKSKQNTQLKADVDLSKRSERSKVVDEQVDSIQKELDILDGRMDDGLVESDKFWKDYGNKK